MNKNITDFRGIDFFEELQALARKCVDTTRVISDSQSILSDKMVEVMKKAAEDLIQSELKNFKSKYKIAKAQGNFVLEFLEKNYTPEYKQTFFGLRFNGIGGKLYEELCDELFEYMKDEKDLLVEQKSLPPAENATTDCSSAEVIPCETSLPVPTPDIAPPAPIAEPTPPVQAEQQPQTMFTVPNGNNGADIVVGVGIRTNQQQSQQQQQNSPPPTATVPPKEYDFEPQQPPPTN